MATPRKGSGSVLHGVAKGAAFGMMVSLPALGAAVLSGGAGHGGYAAARALFPLPMLLTLVEGSIGPVSGGLALVQFPLYGALLGWSRARRSRGPVIALASLHVAAAVACSAGLLPDFS